MKLDNSHVSQVPNAIAMLQYVVSLVQYNIYYPTESTSPLLSIPITFWSLNLDTALGSRVSANSIGSLTSSKQSPDDP